MSKVLVTGGLGYIGSHTILDLLERGLSVVCVDNLSKSDPKTLDRIERITGNKVPFYQTDICDDAALEKVFEKEVGIESIIHFAAYKSVPESVKYPLKYFKNNVNGLMVLIEKAQKYKVKNFIFSSSCSVYGEPQNLPVTEDTPIGLALSPYAATKQIGEQILTQTVENTEAFSLVILRYFNPVGAHPEGKLGELPLQSPDNLVPYVTQTAIGKREQLTVFGKDYPTKDGTCIRDYIHVMDIATAHSQAISFAREKLKAGQTDFFNLGSGKGYSVLEVLNTFEKVNNVKVNYKFGAKRPGDVTAVFSSNDKARSLLGWKIKFNIEEMMASAWKWEQFLQGE
ncbi:MAG: UDP-glucose 4-epimerase GalE [Chitinophagaceae bacterium]|nr:MAG: UDP-glucose 4-epimerase GalE [Chitinophagaceae bacterium]